MSESLHNPERHGQEGRGRARLWCECGSWCSKNAPCDCCELIEARAEVERLTAERDALRAGGAVAQAAAGKRIAELAAEVERLTADLGALERSRREAEEWIRTLDHRVARALTLLYHPTEVNGCNCLAHQIAAILRAEPRWETANE